MPYRISCDFPKHRLGDKVIAHTKPWSPENIYGHGHHELWNKQVGIITSIYEPRKYEEIKPDNRWYGRGHYFYTVEFSHTTYTAMLSENEMEEYCEKDT